MSENVEALKKGYEDFGKGDVESVQALWADDIQWEGPDHPGLPGAGMHDGADAVGSMLGEIPQNWEEFKVTPDEFFDAGDTVVVLGHLEGRGKRTGKDFKVPVVHIWRMSGGKVVRVQILSATAVMLEALS